jgi:hypothetical protein
MDINLDDSFEILPDSDVVKTLTESLSSLSLKIHDVIAVSETHKDSINLLNSHFSSVRSSLSVVSDRLKSAETAINDLTMANLSLQSKLDQVLILQEKDHSNLQKLLSKLVKNPSSTPSPVPFTDGSEGNLQGVCYFSASPRFELYMPKVKYTSSKPPPFLGKYFMVSGTLNITPMSPTVSKGIFALKLNKACEVTPRTFSMSVQSNANGSVVLTTDSFTATALSFTFVNGASSLAFRGPCTGYFGLHQDTGYFITLYLSAN